MSVALVTGSAGFVGSAVVRFFENRGMDVVGIDNNTREESLGREGSHEWNRKLLDDDLRSFGQHDVDIRNFDALEKVFQQYASSIEVIVHTASRPSQEWTAEDPFTDFSVNAEGTLNLLEVTRKYCRETPFIFTSTKKVYGDRPNSLPLVEQETRWEVDEAHRYADGIAEDMSIDQSNHSLFGTSKAAADLLVQAYGRHFDMKTASFRSGALAGPGHSGTQMNGFLSHLTKCAAAGTPYTIAGHGDKQVHDVIHIEDLVTAFYAFAKDPRSAEVYNLGGGRQSNCSMLEAIRMCEDITGREVNYVCTDEPRSGDHIWYISDLSKFTSHYPEWEVTYDVRQILEQLHASVRDERVDA